MGKALLRDSELLQGKLHGEVWERENPTEAYVTVPSALLITDRSGAMWTLGCDYVTKFGEILTGGRRVAAYKYYWSVLRNDAPVGEFAEKIEYLRGNVYIYSPSGKKMLCRESAM